MLRIRAATRRGLPIRCGLPSYAAELYDVSGRAELLDWQCEHDHDSLFAALMCGEYELQRRQVEAHMSRRRAHAAADRFLFS